MPANRMKTEVASTWKVIGKRSAMVRAGPKPGSTPIAVPSVVPTRHQSRFLRVSATVKPFTSCESASMSRPHEQRADAIDYPAEHKVDDILAPAAADIAAESRDKPVIGDQREGGADQGVTHNGGRAEAARHAHEQGDGRDREAEVTDEQDVEREAGDDPEQGLPVRPDLLLL